MSTEKSPMNPAQADTPEEPSATPVIEALAQTPASAADTELPPAERYAAAIREEIRRLSESKIGSEGVEERLEAEHIWKIFEAAADKAARGEPTGWERE
jgi:hypothetical protein